MTTKPEERKTFQVWVNTSPEVIEEAKAIAEKKRMTFRGFLGIAIENAVEAERDKVGN